MGVTTIVLAGDRLASHPVFGRNKALLPVQGRALVAHVVRALLDVPDVDRVCVVGPVDRLQAVLASVPTRADQERQLVPQGRTLYDNVWRAFLQTLGDGATPDAETLAGTHGDALVAIVTGDAPLLTAPEMNHFLRHADMERYDYVLGLTPIESLVPYAPKRRSLGIRMAALNVAEGGFRQNNLHMVRPFRVANKQHIEEFYEHRYQKEWWHALRLVASVVMQHEDTLRALEYLARMQVSMRAQLYGWPRLAARVRRGVRMADVCAVVSSLLHTRFATLVCPGAGSALDIDNEHDLVAMTTHFTEWHRHLLAGLYAT